MLSKTRWHILGNWGLGATALDILAEHPSCDVIEVVTRYDECSKDFWYNRVWEVAQAHNLKTYNYHGRKRSEIVEHIKNQPCDILLSVSFTLILPNDCLVLPSCAAINIHPGLLPAFRGRKPVDDVLARGTAEHGITAHFMDEGTDTGDIIIDSRFSTQGIKDRKTLLDKQNELVPSLVGTLISHVDKKSLPRRKQDG